MSDKVPLLLLKDIIEAINDIDEFRFGMEWGSFLSDKKTQSAVIRKLEVIGEASNRIPKSYRDVYPNVEWNKIIRTRHILIHEYEDVNLEIVWRIITIHLPGVRIAINKIIDNSSDIDKIET
jgi:uncharacterized protein with HEPN domain